MYEYGGKELEFHKILAELTEYCLSEEGRDLVEKQRPLYDPERLEEIHDYVAEFHDYLNREELPGLEFPPIFELTERLKTRAVVLEGAEIFAFARYFRSARRLQGYLKKAGEYGYEKLVALGAGIPEFDALAREIGKVLDPDGSVKDSHPELRSKRKQLSAYREELNRAAQNYLRSNSDRWQSDVPTQRDGRLVLPLKSQYRNTVDGVIHYSSARGATVYIEPPEVMSKNNDIALVEEEIREIIIKILRDLSAKLAERRLDIIELIDQVSLLDSYLCRGRFAKIRHCVRAKYRRRGFVLKRARHPLLKDEAVPIDIAAEEGVQALIISGPNAGGKTVSLKTVGLLAMMNQFGMQIPAEEGSELAVFDGIYADIGDEQSIEGSLSTFSGHMSKISRMLEQAGDSSLLLLDELGSGTDPGEGASLAMAILEEFLRRGATILATSHHSLLKNFAYTTAGVQNASMDFDSSTLSPNYRVIAGMPGESHALDIASRSGIPESIVAQARDYFAHEKGEVGRMIRELENKQAESRERERELAEREKQLKEQIKEQDLKALRLRQREHELRNEGYGALRRFVDQARSELENLVRELNSSKNRDLAVSRQETKKVKEFIKKLEERTTEERRDLDREEELFNKSEEFKFVPGMKVLTGPGRREGTILRQDKKNQWLVEVGAMKISLAEKDLEPLGESGGVKKTRRSTGVSFSYSSDTPPPAALFNLDLRGKRLDEALETLNRQIDNALLQDLREFEVIHGKGEGVLQLGVRKLLAESPRVQEFSFAPPELGGTGKTLVKLKMDEK